ncbi:hypothetical protein SAMD00020551_0470 [Mesobacillus selenatarsenatis SF-1]|uniref:Uncharacterized protein n=1 Tax=Mesobacillus selenatarsenatis (strain DSM 18680 / JCM 14380 / FERM P-15431 / SF-1) TaxID=1321606 RepID=A0A0A8WXI4_MESS1|nr:hypothetical protein SAMD00020551_0470 [Mesobacillus selenatarsenatis SF-1]
MKNGFFTYFFHNLRDGYDLIYYKKDYSIIFNETAFLE